MTVILIGVGWALAVIAFVFLAVGLCAAAARGDDLARRVLGSASSDDRTLQIASSMDDTTGPPAERRRA
jgi:hypothetical protein